MLHQEHKRASRVFGFRRVLEFLIHEGIPLEGALDHIWFCVVLPAHLPHEWQNSLLLLKGASACPEGLSYGRQREACAPVEQHNTFVYPGRPPRAAM